MRQKQFLDNVYNHKVPVDMDFLKLDVIVGTLIDWIFRNIIQNYNQK